MGKMIAPIYVELDDDDLIRARRVAAGRAAMNSPQSHGYNGDRMALDLPGACGECAFHKGLGLVWSSEGTDTFKLPDARWNIQIRTAPCKAPRPPVGFGTLIVRPDDDPRDCYALVAGNFPYFVLLGWIVGAEARADRWWKAEAGRPEAWFVPNSALNPDLGRLLDG